MQLSGLFRYPVKGLRGVALQTAAVEPCGLAGDRRWMVVDAEGRFLSQRRLPRMARIDARLRDDELTLDVDGDRITVAHPARGSERLAVTVWRSHLQAPCPDADADRWLSAHLRQPCRLVFLDDPRTRPVEPPYGRPGEHVSFADAFPVLACSSGALATLNRALARTPGGAIGMDRFRPNLVVEGAGPWAEDDWRLLRIGGMLFRGAKGCVRCAVPGIDQHSGDTPDPGEPLRTLRRVHRHADGVVFGRNLVPQGHGVLSVGDAVEILEREPLTDDPAGLSAEPNRRSP